MSRFVWAPLTWIVLAGFYLFLAGSLGTVEIIAALVCCTLGTALAVGLSLVAHQHFTLRPAPRAILRPLAALLPEFLTVGRELATVVFRGAGRHHGDYVHQPFDFGAADPRDAGRRAMTTVGVSLAPRTFLVRGERSDGTLLLHGFPPKPVSEDARWPAA